MKLYKCQMLDESMDDWDECVVAVMESQAEQDAYYSGCHTEARKKLLLDSGYNPEDYHIEFNFPYELHGINYAEEISKGIGQSACDASYANFELIMPTQEKGEKE